MRMLPLVLCLALAAPAAAQQAEPADPPSDLREGLDRLGEGARLLLRGLMAEMQPALQDMAEQMQAMEPMLRSLAEMIGDIRNYDMPERLPNGDIILRRKPGPPPQPPEGEVEL
jgi:hypothetical protein